MTQTAWLTPSTNSSGSGLAFTNPTNAYVEDGVYATTPANVSSSGSLTVNYPSLGGSGISISTTSSTVSTVTAVVTAINGTAITQSMLNSGNLTVLVSIYLTDFTQYVLNMGGFDFSSIAAGSTINSVTAKVVYRTVSGSLQVDAVSLKVDYAPASQSLSPTGIGSTSAMGSSIVTPDATSITMSGSAGAQSFGQITVDMYVSSAGTIGSGLAVGTVTVTQSDPPPAPPTDWEAIGKEDDKDYIYRVYSGTTFMGIWTDVGDIPQFTQHINTPGTTMTVKLNRSPNTTKEVRAQLLTQAGDMLTTEDGYGFDITYQTNNSVGAGTDVDINLNVDVYVHYGQFDNLVTQLGDFITTEDGDYLMASSGSPGGKRIFSGYILDYESRYGDQNGVMVTLASNGAELSQAIVRSGENIIVTYPSQEIATTVKSILDTNPGVMTYDASSIVNTGVSIAATFQLNTKLEAIQSLFNQTPDGFYWYGDVATNQVVLKQASTTADHTFRLGQDIKEMALKRSQEQLRNLVYFVGAQDSTTGISKLKKYQDTTSQTAWRVGLERITDRRYSLDTSMQLRANKDMGRYKNPIYTTTVTVSAARYDIETIQIGQMVAFANTDNFLKDLLLQIVSKSYTPTGVTLQLGDLLDQQYDVIDDIGDAIDNEQYQSLPTAPS